jgi:hypothetical protein
VALESLRRDLARRQGGGGVVDEHVELGKPLVETAAKSRTDAGEERSIPMTVTDVAAVLLTIACLATSPRGVLRQPRITSAPMRASSRAVSLPMPLLAPVMSATRAERSTSSGFIALRLPWR